MTVSIERKCKTVVLDSYVDEGVPGPEHFRIEESTVKSIENEGDILVQVLVMSADPYLRGGIKSTRTGMTTVSPGSPMKGFIAGKIVESKNEKWPVGRLIGASLPFSTVQVVPAALLAQTIAWDLTPHLNEDQISLGLSILGMPGATAYGGLKDVLRPTKEGETLFVSGAAGAVGGMVGQLAKNVFGLTTIGSCGGEAKGKLIKTKYGFDNAIDYKAAGDSATKLASMIKEAAPEGIDMYYENVGGMHIEAAFSCLRPHGRIAICGMISQYNDPKKTLNTLPLMNAIYTFQRIEGFVCFPWLSGQRGSFLKDMSAWWKEGKIKMEETFFEGVEQWPNAFQSLFTGKKTGKVVVRITHDSPVTTSSAATN